MNMSQTFTETSKCTLNLWTDRGPKPIRIHSGWSSRTQQINPFCRRKTESDRFPARTCVCVYVYIYIDFNFTTPAQPNQVPKILYTDVDYPKRSHYWYLPQKKVIIIYYKSKANQDWYYKNHGYSDKKCQVIIINHFNNHTHRIHGAGIYANIWGILMVKYGKC